jgi:hypothetical protein
MRNLIADLTSDLQQAHVLWQLGVLLLCLGGAWQLQRIYRHRVIRRADVDGTLTLGIGSVQRLLFPISALALMLFGRWLLHHWQPVKLLNLAVPLLFSFALIRIAFYLLRHTFAAGGGYGSAPSPGRYGSGSRFISPGCGRMSQVSSTASISP